MGVSESITKIRALGTICGFRKRVRKGSINNRTLARDAP